MHSAKRKVYANRNLLFGKKYYTCRIYPPKPKAPANHINHLEIITSIGKAMS